MTGRILDFKSEYILKGEVLKHEGNGTSYFELSTNDNHSYINDPSGKLLYSSTGNSIKLGTRGEWISLGNHESETYFRRSGGTLNGDLILDGHSLVVRKGSKISFSNGLSIVPESDSLTVKKGLEKLLEVTPCGLSVNHLAINVLEPTEERLSILGNGLRINGALYYGFDSSIEVDHNGILKVYHHDATKILSLDDSSDWLPTMGGVIKRDLSVKGVLHVETFHIGELLFSTSNETLTISKDNKKHLGITSEGIVVDSISGLKNINLESDLVVSGNDVVLNVDNLVIPFVQRDDGQRKGSIAYDNNEDCFVLYGRRRNLRLSGDALNDNWLCRLGDELNGDLSISNDASIIFPISTKPLLKFPNIGMNDNGKSFSIKGDTDDWITIDYFNGNISINADVILNGSLNYRNVNNLTVEDQFIRLNRGCVSPQSGIEIENGGTVVGKLSYITNDGKWNFNHSVVGNILDPIEDFDVVNKRYLERYVASLEEQLSVLQEKLSEVLDKLS